MGIGASLPQTALSGIEVEVSTSGTGLSAGPLVILRVLAAQYSAVFARDSMNYSVFLGIRTQCLASRWHRYCVPMSYAVKLGV